MPQVLTYTIINAQLATLEQQIEIDGQPATASFIRAVVEAQPTDQANKTLTVVLPPEALNEFAEGSSITVTIAATAAQSES